MTHPATRSPGPGDRPSSASGPVAGPRAPAAVKWAAEAMLVGAALTAVLGGLLTARWDHPSGDIRSGVPGLVLGIVVTTAGCIPWLWMAWMALAGRGWARVLSAVFFGIYFVSFVPSLIISFIPARFSQPPGPRVVAEVGLELLAGLAAIILLWQPASSRFFSASRQARTARM